MGGCGDGRCGCGWLNNYMQSICPCNSWFGLEGDGLEGVWPRGGLTWRGFGLEGSGLVLPHDGQIKDKTHLLQNMGTHCTKLPL